MKKTEKQLKRYKKHRTFSLYWLFYDHCRWLFAPFAALIFRTKKVYIDKKATVAQIKKGAMIVSNHISFYDALVLQYAFWYRRVHSMMLDTAFQTKIGSLFFRGVNCFPINPSNLNSSFASMRQCVARLQYGYVVAMFPEGHINFSTQPEIKEFQSGSVFMALQAKSVIIPCFLYRQKGKFHRFHLYIGKPFNPQDYFSGAINVESMQLVTQQLRNIELKMQNEYLEKVGKK